MTVAAEVDDAMATLIIDNPPANIWSPGTVSALADAVVRLRGQDAIRCLVITGAGPRYFSAGADIREFDHGEPQRAADYMSAFSDAFGALAAFPGLTIAVINGYALGGGLECALACDLRIAEAHAVIGLPEATVGVLPGGGGTQRLTRLAGTAWAKRLMLMAERLDAATALRAGVVDEVVPSGDGLAKARDWAFAAGTTSPGSAQGCKTLIDGALNMTLEEGLARERRAFADLFGTPDQREGVQSFLEKRRPAWPSRVQA